MAISLISRALGYSTDNVTAVSAGITTTNADFGLLIVGCVNDAGAPLIYDSKQNYWNTKYTITQGNNVLRVLYCPSPLVGTGHTATVIGGGYPFVLPFFLSGVNLDDPFDTVEATLNTGGSSPFTIGSITPSQANSLVLSAIGLTALSTGITPTVNGGFTAEAIAYVTANVSGGLAWLQQTTATAANPQWTTSTATAHCGVNFVVKPRTASEYMHVVGQQTLSVLQRNNGESHDGTVTGRYGSTTPTTVEYEVSNTTGDIVTDWTAAEDLVAASNAYSCTINIPVGFNRRYRTRSKNGGGTVLATSGYSNGTFGVGVIVWGLGQSNLFNWLSNFSDSPAAVAGGTVWDGTRWYTPEGRGQVEFLNKMVTDFGIPVGFVASAIGGKGLTDDWMSLTAGQPYPLAVIMLNAIGGDAEFVLFHGCEKDAFLGVAGSLIETSFGTLFTRIQSQTGRDPGTAAGEVLLSISLLGNIDDGGVTTDEACTEVVLAQLAFISDNEGEGVICSGSARDLERTDQYHLVSDGYASIARRTANALAYAKNFSNFSSLGPQVVSPFRITGDAVIRFPVNQAGGTAIVNGEGDDDGADITGIEAAEDADFEDTLTLEGSVIDGEFVAIELPSSDSDNFYVRGGLGANPDPDIMVFDNNVMTGEERGFPLLPFAATLVDTVTEFDPTSQVITEADLPLVNGLGIVGYTVKSLQGVVLIARTTSGISRISVGSNTARYSAYFTPPTGYSVVYAEWDDGSGNTYTERISVSAGNGFTGLSPKYVDDNRRWRFTAKDQNNAVNTIYDIANLSADYFALDFDDVLHPRSVIQTATILTSTPTGLTIGTPLLETNLREVHIPITSTTTGTYTIVARAVTVDGAKYTRRFILVLGSQTGA